MGNALVGASASAALLLSAAAEGGATMPRAVWIVLAVLAVIFVVAAVLLVVHFLRLRRAEAPTRIGRSAGLMLNKRSLVPIWKRFLRDLPRSARPLVQRYPWVVVLGDPGAGKSYLINAKSDWQSLASQFLPSYTEDMRLQVYLGRRAVVHELAGPLVLSNETGTEEALRALWQPLCRVQPPLVLLVVNLKSLQRATPEQLRTLATRMRGKMGLLSELSHAPLPVRLCITHMEYSIGSEELARFLRDSHIPFTLDLRDLDGRPEQAAQLGTLVQSFEQYVSVALTTLPSSTFARIVKFLKDAPEVLAKPAEFLAALLDPSGLLPAPSIERVYFTQAKTDLQIANPFLTGSARDLPRLTPELRRRGSGWLGLLPPLSALGSLGAVLRTPHALVCAALLLIALVFFGVVYSRHGERVEQADTASRALETAVQRARDSLNPTWESTAVRSAAQLAGERLRALRASESRWPLLRRALTTEKETARTRYLAAVRQGYFAPLLNVYGAPPVPAVDKLLYTMASLHAGPDNSLGELVRERAPLWSASLGMPELVLRDYAALADSTCAGPGAPEPHITAPPGSSPLSDPAPWQRFLSHLQAVLPPQKGDTEPSPRIELTRAELSRLKAEAAPLLAAVELLERSRSLTPIARTLSEECRIDVMRLLGPSARALLPAPFLESNLAPLGGVLRMVSGSSLDGPSGSRVSISELLAAIDTRKNSKQPSAITYDVLLQQTPYHFSEQQWLDVLAEARRRQVLRSVTGSPRTRKTDADDGERPHRRRHHRSKKEKKEKKSDDGDDKARDKEKKDKDDGPRFTAQSFLNGPPAPYNKVSFDKDVRPGLVEADKTISAAQLSPKEQERLLAHISDESNRYAKRYRETLLAFHNSFALRGDSLPALRASLAEVTRGDGAFTTHLRTVADNADIPGLDGPYMLPLAGVLLPFRPIVKLMTPKDGALPDLDAYRAIIAQMATGLYGGKTAAALGAAAPAGSGSGSLTDSLSEAGRTALSILTEQPDSPLVSVEKWLDKAAIPLELRPPFLLPVQRMFKSGVSEIERALEARWKTLQAQSVAPLYGKFPFDRGAREDVALAALDAIRPKDGALWQAVQRDLSPFLLQSDGGTFSARRLAAAGVSLPPGMLATLNQLGKLSRMLWDKDGARQALTVRVRPLPFPTLSSGPAVTRAFLSVGRAVVEAHNEMPADRSLAVTWWAQENASVGCDLSVADSQTKQHRSLDETRSAWSFFRLLTRARLSADGSAQAPQVATWALPPASGDGDKVDIRFGFAEDPWAPFSPPAAEK